MNKESEQKRSDENQETVGEQPMATVMIGDSRITLLGTAHVSRSSAEKVKELIETGDYDAVAVEL
ncbi:MAG TPA: hypothetical protein ENI97_16085, partial [Gammaproteobacteria bacterium]|nr:hypothetical protein [Gammaproteobacteria bacterium]